jgi:signal transduction histidine kinase/ligand-binding sensor domain-containing protein/DNA-binding response OmpR family regulator
MIARLKYRMLCILFLLLSLCKVWGHGLKYHEFIPVDHRTGLNASAVYCVVQDESGLIWIGTDRGLFSFDGYTAHAFVSGKQPEADNNGVIYCGQMIDSIHLWLGADNGLLVFNTYTDKFELPPAGLPANIRAISRINDHSFWIGSLNGLYRYDLRTGKTDRVRDELLPHQAIYTILRYDENTFYFGTYDGLCRYDVQTGKYKSIPLGKSSPSSNQLILCLLADYDLNSIWIGVEGGLYKYSPGTEKSEEVSLFRGNSVKSLLLDNQHCLWAGTDNGLYIYDSGTRKYRLIRHDALNDRSILNNVIWSIFTDKEQNIWVGTDAGVSLYVYNESFSTHSVSEITGSNEGNQIISILEDSHNNLWLGGTNGLIRLDKTHGNAVWFQQNSPVHPIPHNKVRYIYEDSDGDIWIATDGSICRYNDKSSSFIRYQVEDESHTRNANWSYAICQDETRKLWIATCLGGIFVVDKRKLLSSQGNTCTAERNYSYNDGPQGLSGNMLQFLSMDRDRNIWAGTYRAGINKIDRMNGKVVRLTSKTPGTPLISDEVTAMLIDGDNYLWIALRNKILRMDARKNTVQMISDTRLNEAYINALADDGKNIWICLSTGLYFIDKSTLKLKQINTAGDYYSAIFYDKTNHRLIAGGINEYVEFDPDVIISEDNHNKLFTTALWINEKLIQNNGSNDVPVKLSESIRYARSIDLPYNCNNLSLTFSELSYSLPGKGLYANKLEGLDPEWRFTGRGTNKLTYNNIPPGDYTLMISRVGSDGNPMPGPLKLSITVRHPWYLSGPAKIIYGLLCVLLLMAFVNYYLVLNRLKFERLDKIRTTELTAHKIEFLTNLSHELKTPLSLIIGPLGKINEQVKNPEAKNQLAAVRNNALKMGTLIHRMMDASRQEFDGFGLIVSTTDLVPFVKSVASVFEKQLADKSARITFENEFPSLSIEADVFKLEIILNNVLSNAVKFAPEGSAITIRTEKKNDHAVVLIEDEGPGIDAQDLRHVFERFFQSRHSLPQNKDGSGIGLSIVKEYVKLHHGSVNVISDGIKGTKVEILLPVKQLAAGTESAFNTGKEPGKTAKDNKPLLLVVEDNLEILSFISESLSREFNCITALNGKLGFEAAIAYKPDIIVTDIMMPVMDGMEMCRKLRENIATSLIPVVMLTARDDKNTEISGYSIGADAFIAKPFEIGYLSDRLNHLLKGRDMMVQKARQEALLKPKESAVISSDEKFLATITQIIENEMTNPEMNVNVLSEKSGYSAKQVYRRIKTLTGQTAVDYIRTVRLKKAAILLMKKTFTVAEVMYMVGFTNHSYFSKRFQEMYGKTPRHYAGEESG